MRALDKLESSCELKLEVYVKRIMLYWDKRRKINKFVRLSNLKTTIERVTKSKIKKEESVSQTINPLANRSALVTQ